MYSNTEFGLSKSSLERPLKFIREDIQQVKITKISWYTQLHGHFLICLINNIFLILGRIPNGVQIFVGVISVSFYIYRHNIHGDRFYEANDKSVYHYYGIILQLVLYDRRRLSQLGPSKTGHSHHY